MVSPQQVGTQLEGFALQGVAHAAELGVAILVIEEGGSAIVATRVVPATVRAPLTACWLGCHR